MTAPRVTVVSDTHLSPATPEAQANWEAVLRHVADTAPDLVVHAGDLSLDGAADPNDLDHAHRQLDRLTVPWRVVPGNHDVGDNVLPEIPKAVTVDADRHRRWVDAVGPDRWSVELDGWTLLGLDAQLLGSGLAAEAAQWDWLAGAVADAGDRPVVLVTHKPLTAGEHELADGPNHRFVPPAARRRLGDLFRDRRLALVVSGHVHQYRCLDAGGTRHVWAPTTWAVLPDDVQPPVGLKRCGVVTLELHGSPAVEPVLVEPPGLAQLMLWRDLPDPYSRH